MYCPIGCGSTRRAFQKNGFWIRECPVCRLRFVEIKTSPDHVRQIYGDDYFFDGGAGYSDYLREAKIITGHGKRYGELLNKYMQPGRVLDVGAAAGFVLKGLGSHGWQGVGLEPNATMAEYGCKQLGVDIEVGSLDGFRSAEKFDLLTMIQVLPHLYDLRHALNVATDLTKPSGYWLIETWNRDSFAARMWGKFWHEYNPPSVLYFFSPKTLRLLVRQYSFEEVARGSPTKRISGRHAKSLLLYKLKDSPMERIGTKLINLLTDDTAIPYPSLDLFWALYKKAN
jgi:2-polyprenyl-3-methyl-5-hydroxy-6-metoxy-1,4-benzoquinol methylase